VGLAQESFQFHRKWIKLPTDFDAFDRYLSGFDGENSFCFVVCDEDSIVGSVSLTHIEREPYDRGRLGYGVFEKYARMGYMSSGLEHVIDFAFRDLGLGLGLHRLEADVQLENVPSARLVKRMGFKSEGISRKLIQINGEYVDHERWALTSNEWFEKRQ